MYPSTNHTIGSPCHLPLDACAELCFKKSYHVTIRRRTLNHLAPYINEKLRNSERGIRNTRSDRGDTCKAFEYIVSTGYCILLKKAAATDSQGYQSLKTASGTTYFELSKSVQDLYMKKNHVVFDGQDKYNNIISNISAEKCAYECINAPDLSCNSFVYSTSLHVCALSSHVASKNVHFKTTSFYDFYQYSGRKFGFYSFHFPME
ncbi:uncharacterized protein LOC132729801 [Ruditapes philippinarum]|uniref:uncharacterized protein LOC132729801 n=1 Tax=Ruditapes philippinarum TaxID=129788 RepID=UPI00295AA1A0|nr:uncharacterized protein LOC132729801 [Ruditapes philippinarum]